MEDALRLNGMLAVVVLSIERILRAKRRDSGIALLAQLVWL
jgi:hypothetical protein